MSHHRLGVNIGCVLQVNIKDLCMKCPEFHFESAFDTVTKICNATHSTLNKLHVLEEKFSCQISHKLAINAVTPSNHERQKRQYFPSNYQ